MEYRAHYNLKLYAEDDIGEVNINFVNVGYYVIELIDATGIINKSKSKQVSVNGYCTLYVTRYVDEDMEEEEESELDWEELEEAYEDNDFEVIVETRSISGKYVCSDGSRSFKLIIYDEDGEKHTYITDDVVNIPPYVS